MGRRAGVTAEETRRQIIDAAAKVFARRGYEGASVSEISSEAGLSNGALYAHYASKGELFIATLREHTRRQVAQLLGETPGDFLDALASIGATLDSSHPVEGSLLMEAIVAGKRDPKVAALLSATFVEREDLLVELAGHAQAAEVLDPSVAPEAVARFTLMLALGAVVAAAIELPPVEHGDWSALIHALADRARGPRRT